MLRYLEKITSLKNLSYARPSGQIATLLMLVMVGVLVMIMVTVNLGKVSNTATSLSNAADSAALYLASQLATKSTQLYQALDYKTEKCQKGGFMALFLAIIVAIIIVAIVIVSGGAAAPGAFTMAACMKFAADSLLLLTAVGAAAGAAGGAAGGAIAGTGVLQGALQGAMIGAAIGSIASSIGSAVSASQAAATVAPAAPPAEVGELGPLDAAGGISEADMATMPTVGEMGGNLPQFANMGVADFSNAATGIEIYSASPATTAGATNAAEEAMSAKFAEGATTQEMLTAGNDAAIANGADLHTAELIAQKALPAVLKKIMLKSAASAAMSTLGVGAKFYNESVDQKMTFAAISAAAKSTQNLPELDRYRENVFLQALSQTVDDPRDTKDAGVCQEPKDGDGTMKCDPYDSDGDGNKKETVPYFQYWWDRRMEAFKSIIPKLKNRTNDFVFEDTEYTIYDVENKEWVNVGKDGKAPLDNFKDFAKSQYMQNFQCLANSTGVFNSAILPECYGSYPASCQGYGGDEYGSYYNYPSWSAGALYRSGLDGQEWKDYLNCNGSKGCKDGLSCEPGGDGSVIAAAKALEKAGIELDFYNKNKLSTRKDYEDECGKEEDCGEFHDEVEAVTVKLMNFVETVKSLRKQSLDKLTSTWQTWVKFFYNEDLKCDNLTKVSDGDYYDSFGVLINGDAGGDFKGIKSWREELNNGKKKLPKCKVEQGYSCTDNLTGESRCSVSGDESCTMTLSGDGIYTPCEYFSNAPCKMTDSGGKVTGYTIDSDADDEFKKADDDLAELIDELEEFRSQAKKYDSNMESIYKGMAKQYKDEDFDYGGINPVTYRWSDSRCKSGLKDVCDLDEDDNIAEDYKCHSVEVRASDFKIPWIDEEKSGGFLKKKVCMVMKDYCSDPNNDIYNMFTDAEGRLKCENSNNPVWVKISRKEAGNQDMGILGQWNFTGNDAQDELTDACGNTITDEAETSKDSCTGVDCSDQANADTCCCFNKNNSTSKTSRKSTAYFIYRPRWDQIEEDGKGGKKQNKWVGLTKN